MNGTDQTAGESRSALRTEGSAAEWTVDRLGRPAERTLDRIDELMKT